MSKNSQPIKNFNGDCRHLELWKTFAYHYFLAYLHQIWWECGESDAYGISFVNLVDRWHLNHNLSWQFPPVRISKTVASRLFFDRFVQNLIAMLWIWLKTHVWCRKNARWQKFKMAPWQYNKIEAAWPYKSAQGTVMFGASLLSTCC